MSLPGQLTVCHLTVRSKTRHSEHILAFSNWFRGAGFQRAQARWNVYRGSLLCVPAEVAHPIDGWRGHGGDPGLILHGLRGFSAKHGRA